MCAKHTHTCVIDMYMLLHIQLFCACSNGYINVCSSLVAANFHALLVVAGGGVVGVDDCVSGEAVSAAGLGPGVDGVHVWRRNMSDLFVLATKQLCRNGLSTERNQQLDPTCAGYSVQR